MVGMIALGGVVIGFALGFLIWGGSETSGGEKLSPDLTAEEMAEIVAEVRSTDIGVQITAKVMYIYPLPVQDDVERWAVSGSFFWPQEPDGSRMRTKFFLVVTHQDGEWDSTDWNISTAEPYFGISDMDLD